MKIFNIVAIFVYTLIFSIIGGFLIALSLRTESLDSIINLMSYLSQTSNIRLTIALTGLFLILINISIAQLSIGKLRKHKTIAFENPNGQVTISLGAIEDYIKKLTQNMTEIKDMKSNISAGRSGIEVVSKAVLYSDANIPEITEKIQNAIKYRLQEMLGIEETVAVKIHVIKVVERSKKTEKKNITKQPEPSGFKGEIEYGK